jgi:hypothetical protein
MASVTIDGNEYNIEDFSDEAKQQLQSLQFTDAELQKLQMTFARIQTARNVYAHELQTHMPEKTAHPNKKKGVITIDDKKYSVDDFSEAGTKLLNSVQMAEGKLLALRNEIAMTQTARQAYGKTLKAMVEA